LKKLVTFRFDPELLERAKASALRENRTLTNYVETVLKRAIDTGPSATEQTGPRTLGSRD
jgi:predicted HicB family RNase H-like nuclease